MTEIKGAGQKFDAQQITITIKNNGKKTGITFELLNHVKQLGLKFSDGNVSKAEWEQTLKVLDDINNNRIKTNKGSIFGQNYSVKNGQQINFTAEEMSRIYQAMGVEISNAVPKEKKPTTVQNDSTQQLKTETNTPRFQTLASNINVDQEYTIKTDNIPDTKKNARIDSDNRIMRKTITTTKPTRWRGSYADYTPTNKTKYDRVYNRIINNKDLTNKSDAKYLANMVCKLADQYGIDPEIVETILANESHYVFEPKVMVHPGSKYKGVAQVGPDVTKTMYADPKDASNTKLSKKERAIAYDSRHYKSDSARISELKKQYPTPEALYEAIQHDVALGLEVGIMHYKARLSMANGSTVRAMAGYCGNQYKLPSSSLYAANDPIPSKIYPIPRYSRA